MQLCGRFSFAAGGAIKPSSSSFRLGVERAWLSLVNQLHLLFLGFALPFLWLFVRVVSSLSRCICLSRALALALLTYSELLDRQSQKCGE